MTQLLERAIALQKANDDLAEANERLHGIPDWMAELHEEHSVQKKEIDSLSEQAEAEAQARREAETEIEEIQEKLHRYQTQINQVTTQREYGALLQEIDTAKGRVTELEELGITCMERREVALQELEEKKAAFSDLDQRYGTELAKWEAKKPSVARKVKSLTKAIEKLREEIPRQHLSLYDRIAKRHGGSALAPIRELQSNRKGPRSWHCSGCNFNVRPQVVVGASAGDQLLHCDSCKRILFLEETEEEA
ncbi:MAG: hypothetical protein K0U98_21905 [Deltaproteobacteria bacterium]|nr:hypothetical protein [Deltaproteobacteria bacterium]